MSLFYIAISGYVAAKLAQSTTQLAEIERWKGFAFVGVTGLLLFVVSFWMLKRHARVIAERADANRALGAAQQKALAAEMAASVAHDFRNLLGVIQGSIDLINETSSRDSIGEITADILVASQRGTALADKMIAAARGLTSATRAQCRLAEVVSQSLRLVRQSQRLRSCTIVTRLDQELVADADAILIDQMVSNLILNAGDATENRGRILIIVRGDESDAVLEVHDDGPGLPQGDWSNLFSPFRSSKRGGWGLGLMSVKLAAEAHEGMVETIPSEFGGAGFRVRFPKHSRKLAR